MVEAAAVIEGAGNLGMSDDAVIERMRRGEVALFEVIMRRYNQRLYRAARAIVGDDSEAEDVLQDTYVRAYAHLDQFAGRASLATWLTKIAVNEALARARRRGRFVDMEGTVTDLASPGRGPEQATADGELRTALERAIEALSDPLRVVFMLRDVEGLSTAETAACLDIPEETVKTRLHRARGVLRRSLLARIGEAATEAFHFGAARCDRVVAQVLARIAAARNECAS